ncbi:MAG: hypothetical protein HFH82_01785 [Lachnospiraceae bacterium]|nr:hypothetical protein [Lachnospiraceae bacterium]
MLKKFMKKVRMNLQIDWAYRQDCIEYKRWQYNNSNIKTKDALEAKILRQTHVIEKGMSIEKPKKCFGVQKVSDLFSYIQDYVGCGYEIEESLPVLNAIEAIGCYLNFHKNRGFEPQDLIQKYEKIKLLYQSSEQVNAGTTSLNKRELDKNIHGEFPEFFRSRHSIRQFSDVQIKEEDVKKAVSLAMYAPSACNRQPCKVYFYKDIYINQKLSQEIAGNTGFGDDVKNYLVITSNISAFYDAFERNQVYVDGGIFTLALVEALHYYGIASCILQNGERKKKNVKFKQICGNIPENEKIILFIAIGYYKEKFECAASQRKKLDEYLKIK